LDPGLRRDDSVIFCVSKMGARTGQRKEPVSQHSSLGALDAADNKT